MVGGHDGLRGAVIPRTRTVWPDAPERRDLYRSNLFATGYISGERRTLVVTSETGGPPPFDSPFDGEDVEQRLYGVVLETRSPTAAPELARQAECDPKTARKYLEWFAELGVVDCHDGRPQLYERNERYLEWRTVERLATEHSRAELRRRAAAASERIESFRERYDVDEPEAVDAVAEADTAEDGDPLGAVYDDLIAWETALAERRRYERARRRVARTEETAGAD